MKRLTKKVDGAWTAICEYGNPPYPVVTQDVIDRLAAIEDILCDEYDLDRLRELAPVKHGYWMDSSNGWTCSECISDNMRDTKWCPNCGAKMDRKVPD